ncbi:MAG: hypothetical protein KA715_05985 [Xanthomonadaceae bacterium]|nr:hypothetical protein [Xanthomonadaceae bacterium]
MIYFKQTEDKKIPIKYYCKKINIFTNFHGMPDFIGVPFAISKTFSEYYHAKEVCYDGHSCNVFDRTDLIEDYAKKLSEESPETKFSISGNQNPGGWINTESLFKRWFSKNVREDKKTSSRVQVNIDKVKVSVKYDPCSRAGDRCIWINPNNLLPREGDTNDMNEKKCIDHGKLTTQVCCPKRDNRAWRNGVWLQPEEVCE